MKDEIKEIKIGMYTTDEILEFMTNGEGRGFMGRSMYDAILDYITNLQKENERLKEENKHIFANVNDDQLLRSNAMNYAEAQDYKTRNEKASTYIEHYLIGNIAKAENCQRSLKYLLNILQGKSDE